LIKFTPRQARGIKRELGEYKEGSLGNKKGGWEYKNESSGNIKSGDRKMRE
jgi:hypothetical protein